MRRSLQRMCWRRTSRVEAIGLPKTRSKRSISSFYHLAYRVRQTEPTFISCLREATAYREDLQDFIHNNRLSDGRSDQ